ncbi:MAG: hypothetical protein IKP86_08815 [Anaerolineaceae bacterium]|nr:hypothetical protein [Anaerolineaceae bacterium]
MKKHLFWILCALVFYTASAVNAQDVRVKCGFAVMNVTSTNVRCLQIDENIVAADGASREEIAKTQIASTILRFEDLEYIPSAIRPQVIFYDVNDLGKVSLSLLDVSMNLSDMLDNIRSGYGSVEDVYTQTPFLPYQVYDPTASWQPALLDFNNGSGIRRIVVFGDTVFSSISECNLYYAYQGMTDDGLYYISAVFPLTSSSLNGKPAAEAGQSGGSSDYQPSLDRLDYYIKSIVIE